MAGVRVPVSVRGLFIFDLIASEFLVYISGLILWEAESPCTYSQVDLAKQKLAVWTATQEPVS